MEANSEKYPAIFSSALLDAKEGEFINTGGHSFVCKECGTDWYLEWASEQTSWPIFGVKTKTAYATNDNDVGQAQRELLTLLLGGESKANCLVAGCAKRALQNIYLCADHYGFP
ncbi:hypothetical protein ACO0K9_13845 [Undibacterium sp. Ji50W]|uniref:hypothetical protein n=1 Tax=Undibacterium sp. Ji50W TaxID=3413041 RepID=UPI003BF0B339